MGKEIAVDLCGLFNTRAFGGYNILWLSLLGFLGVLLKIKKEGKEKKIELLPNLTLVHSKVFGWLRGRKRKKILSYFSERLSPIIILFLNSNFGNESL